MRLSLHKTPQQIVQQYFEFYTGKKAFVLIKKIWYIIFFSHFPYLPTCSNHSLDHVVGSSPSARLHHLESDILCTEVNMNILI